MRINQMSVSLRIKSMRSVLAQSGDGRSHRILEEGGRQGYSFINAKQWEVWASSFLLMRETTVGLIFNMLQIGEGRQMQGKAVAAGKADMGDGQLGRVKGRFKIGRVKSKEMGSYHHQQLQFNDPLYEYLDGDMQNQEQHNFGPWLSSDRARYSTTHPLLQRTVSQRPKTQGTRAREDRNSRQPQEYSSLPQTSHRSRTSLAQQRVKVLQFRPPSQLIPQFSPKDIDPAIKADSPKTTSATGSLLIPTQATSRRSNVIYNYCLEEDPNFLCIKLEVNRAASLHPQPAAKQKAQPILSLSKLNNQTLFRELKQYRINKFK